MLRLRRQRCAAVTLEDSELQAIFWPPGPKKNAGNHLESIIYFEICTVCIICIYYLYMDRYYIRLYLYTVYIYYIYIYSYAVYCSIHKFNTHTKVPRPTLQHYHNRSSGSRLFRSEINNVMQQDPSKSGSRAAQTNIHLSQFEPITKHRLTE